MLKRMLGNIKQETDSNNTKTCVDSNNVTLVSILKVKKEKKKSNMPYINTTVQFIDNNNDIVSNVLITDNNNTSNNNYTNSNNITTSSSFSSSSIQNTNSNSSCTNKLKSSLKNNSSSSSILSQKNDLKSNIISTTSTIQSTTTTIPTISTVTYNNILEIPGKDIIKKQSNKIKSEINYTNPHDTIILNNILNLNLQIKNKLIEECNIIIELMLRKRYRNLSECKLFEIGGTRKRKLLDSSLSIASTGGIADITSGLTVAAALSATTTTRSTSGMKIEKSNDV